MIKVEYEKYRWFFTSSDKLVIGGKSSKQNEEIMKSLCRMGIPSRHIRRKHYQKKNKDIRTQGLVATHIKERYMSEDNLKGKIIKPVVLISLLLILVAAIFFILTSYGPSNGPHSHNDGATHSH